MISVEYVLAPPIVDGWDWDTELECWCLYYWMSIHTNEFNQPGRFASLPKKGIKK